MDALFVLLSSSCWTVFLSLSIPRSVSLSLYPPLHLPLFIIWNIHRPRLSLKPQAHKHRPIFCFTFHVSLFSPALLCVSFFSSALWLLCQSSLDSTWRHFNSVWTQQSYWIWYWITFTWVCAYLCAYMHVFTHVYTQNVSVNVWHVIMIFRVDFFFFF